MEINRIKIVLAETRRKNKWLAEQLDKDESTISQWCTNARQPSLDTLLNIANVLNVDIRILLHSTKSNL
ncbi:helix-turn-helix domain-containing protein [Polaribacter sp. Hel1_33_78]|uniref:helix-turn-helix domain-containing protein n=1 Tax=Polaribacter sp. Hel1_33_78 TaxID=1336804 RepID=UPI0034A4A8C1